MRMGRLKKLGIKGIHEVAGYRNWVSQEHMRMWVTEIGNHRNTRGCGLQKLGISGTHEMWVTEIGCHRNT
jgi:hypothetical protein